MSAEPSLTGRVIAVVGGDAREQEIARRAALAGAEVRAYGFPWPEGGIERVSQVASAESAMQGADYALFPVPGLGPGGELYAPACEEAILPSARLLALLRPPAAVLLGSADAALEAAAAATGVRLLAYERDEELMLLRSPAIVEGALELAIRHTDATIHGANVGVVGHGTIGRLLARTLVLLGASVRVFARNPVQRAEAKVSGCSAHELEELGAVAAALSMLFSTVPAPVVRAEHLRELPVPALVMDLAAPPGGVDLAAASALGHTAIWARGLGARAPRSVGESQWTGIARRLTVLEERRSQGES